MASRYTAVAAADRQAELLADSYRLPIKSASDGEARANEVAVEYVTDRLVVTDADATSRQILDEKFAEPLAHPITATADGLTTGLIPAGVSRVRVTSENADHIVTLPSAAAIGDAVEISVGANGCELRTNDPATVSLNNVSGAGKELAMGANSIFIARKVNTSVWVASTLDNVGAPAGGGTPD